MNPHAWTAPLSRRRVLRGAGVSLALPWLEALTARASVGAAGPPMRAIFISNNLGVLPKPFFPEGTGADYTPSPSTATSWTNTTHGSSIATAYSGRARGSSPASWTCCSISANTVSKHQASISLLRSLSTVIAQTSPYYS